MAELEYGKKIELEGGKGSVTIISKLGEGGQGYVYKVDHRGRQMALKWYKKGVFRNADKFKENLNNNIKEKAPTDKFLWPIAITQNYDGTFGYIMELRPSGYYELSDFLIGKTEFASIDIMLKAAIEIVDSFRILHNKGFSYQDLNDGNFFIDPQTGNVLICDNDNVSQFGDGSGIAGKCRYMAPAVILGMEGTPNKRTDLFSLAVILFLILLRNHPLEGENVTRKAVMTEQIQKKYYGESPVFIADPIDTSNRPVHGVHNNFITRWPQIPDYIQNAFITAFKKDVMLENKVGVTEKEWLQYLLRFRAEVNICPNCGRETRYTPDITSCVCCKQNIPNYGYIKTPYYNIPIFSKKELVEAYFTDCYDHNEASHQIGTISMNKSRTKASLVNEDIDPWNVNNTLIPNGERLIISNGMRFRLYSENVEIL